VVNAAVQATTAAAAPNEARIGTLVGYLRQVVLAPPTSHERGHAIFLDERGGWLGDAGVGLGSFDALSLRMRALFGEALRCDARGLILAHSHPSGHCRPSGHDIAATRRLTEIGRALDVALIDHLIFTADAVYSMRAGGLL
jgi:DNA repair protein RadC